MQAGRVYACCAYVVTVSSVAAAGRIVSCQVEGLGFVDEPALYGFSLFLACLGATTFAMVRQAIAAGQTRRAPEMLRTRLHEGVAWEPLVYSAGIVALAVSMWSDVSSLLLSPVGILAGLGTFCGPSKAGAGGTWAGSAVT